MAKAAEQARWRRRVAAVGRCASCGRDRLPGLRRCARCLARDLEKRLSWMRHDRKAHARMLERSHDLKSRCASSGLSGRQLRAISQELTVDRRDSSRGYVRGNMQLLARSLNRAKGRGRSVPREAVELLRMIAAPRPSAGDLLDAIRAARVAEVLAR